ncbi:MAG: ribonuclease III [Candidatus Eisenbacteria bacterium]|nr:ribonuclease III [Candidatus Eisenbacteria bacterium]
MEALAQQESRTLAEFMRRYGITFRDPGLLKLALTHRSYLSVTGQEPSESNERLEFLGDSVLGLVTSEYLYLRHPGEHEGQLTKTKSLLVSKAILSRRALRMGLGNYVLLSHSEVESGGRKRLSILADAFESVLGAVYLDQGFETARRFIHRWLLAESDAIVSDKQHTNYKSDLQEYVQSTYHTHPVYRLRSEYGPDHSKYFVVDVMVGRRTLGQGRGQNKKEAEQAAARHAVESVEQQRRAARGAVEREPAEVRGDDEASSADSRRRRRGRRSRGHERDRESEPSTGATAAEPAWEEEREPAEADFAPEDSGEDDLIEDESVEDDGRAPETDAGDDRDESREPAARRESPEQAAPSQEPARDETRLDPYGFAEERGVRPVVELSGSEAEAPDEAAESRDRDARIEEIERAMASFGRQRERHGGGERYGRKGRRGR